MQDLFVVMRRYGPPYAPDRPLEQQADWEPHRAFMNALEAEGVAGRWRSERTSSSSFARRARRRSNGVSPPIRGHGQASS
jgi:hypothetical protein